MPYYGLYVPVKGGGPPAAPDENDTEELPLVFQTKQEALLVLKKHKDARLKEFEYQQDAVKYAETGFEVVQTKYNDVKTPTATIEKGNFRLPTKQKLVEFRKCIERDDHDGVKTMIWDNPRYLVSSGDTPSILKEGYRYNAMHICSLYRVPRIAKLILKTVSDIEFVELLTGKTNDRKMCQEFAANLLDYYLNIPEKGRGETPLHLAAKFGCVEMVEVLTSYPECKITLNDEFQSPKDIINTRATNANYLDEKKIRTLLQERFYVPVLRYNDKTMPPQIGQPFSVANPPNLNSDPMSPDVEIKAVAGPMSKDQAKQFFRRWKTPPRIGSNASSPISSSPFISPMKPRNSTPAKTPRGTNTSFVDSSTAIVQGRMLFNSTPTTHEANGQADENSPASFSLSHKSLKSRSLHFDESFDNSFNDKQNGIHTNVIEDGEDDNEEVIVIDDDDEGNNDVNDKPKRETNNNNQYELKVPLPKTNQITEQNNSLIATAPAAPTTLIPNTNKSQMNMLKTALCPRTPLFKIKRDAFLTYRDQNLASPMMANIDTVNENNKSPLHNTSDIYDSPGYMERHIKNADLEKGLECIGRELAKEQHVEWREYWDFLNEFIDIASEEGLQKFEKYLTVRQNDEDHKLQKLNCSKVQQRKQPNTVILDDVCSALEKFGFSSTATNNDNRAAGDECRSENVRSPHYIRSNNAYTAHQSSTPYTYVEKSLQVHARRMTKTIIHNIDNVLSINDALLLELRRVKSLIYSFKEDISFLNVSFEKVHSRIGNLIAIFLQNSQEVSQEMQDKIVIMLQNLLLTPGERREHIACVCDRIYEILENPVEQIQPENLKTEEMCLKIWQQEKICDCQWESNLSRKTSRRNRMNQRLKEHEKALRDISDKKQQQNIDKWRNPPTDVSSDGAEAEDEEEDVFWSDFGDSDSDEDEVFLTPPESFSEYEDEVDNQDNNSRVEEYHTYIYSSGPTKRDLDVLNAIFHISIDKTNFPKIHSWKSALLRLPNDEMDYFPSPKLDKKNQSITADSSANKNKTNNRMRAPLARSFTSPSVVRQAEQEKTIFSMSSGFAGSGGAGGIIKDSILQLPSAKRLFMSPGRPKSMTAIEFFNMKKNEEEKQQLENTAAIANIDSDSNTIITKGTLKLPPPAPPSSPAAAVPQQKTLPLLQQIQRPMTPLNKLKGLFSVYRERLDSSPLSASSASPANFLADRSATESSNNNLSLLNISASE